MDVTEIKIKDNQKLADVYPIIESDIILNKTLSGIGATHTEITAERDSIIIVPNLPVILCKVAKHKKDNLFGVMQKVSSEDIQSYIEKSKEKKKHIKLMSTPESFYKIKNAFEEADIDMYDSCFFLLDESHKFIKDRDYRPEITQPLREFFNFKNKALVSATPIIPSDPRFIEQNFRMVKIIPDYKHYQRVLIVHTNNILQAFRHSIRFLNKNDENGTICTFINSVDLIQQLIEKCDINDQSAVFCSERSVEKLKYFGIKEVHYEWKPEYKKKYMFFTSRFYNGLDIELDEKPHIIFVSDPYHKDFTMLDPYADMPQAVGRFRNGIEGEITHIVSFNNQIETKTKEEIQDFIKSMEAIYNDLYSSLYKSKRRSKQSAYRTVIENLPLKDLFASGSKDYFVIDNYIDSELLKSAYNGLTNLRKRYESSKYFYNAIENPLYFPFGDQERLSIVNTRAFKKEQRKAIVNALEAIREATGTEAGNEYIQELKQYDSFIVDAYFALGKDEIEKNNYQPKKLRELMLIKKYTYCTRQESFIKALFNSFKPGNKYSRKYAKEELKRIHELFNIESPTAITGLSIGHFFEIDEKARIGNDKAVRLIKPKAEEFLYLLNDNK